MLKRLLLLLLSSAVTAATAGAQDVDLDLAARVDLTGFPIFADPGSRFSVAYPAEWTETDASGEPCFFAGFLRRHEGETPDVALLSVTCSRYARLVGVAVDDVAQALGIDTDDGFGAFVASIEGHSGERIEPLTRGPARLAGRPAFRWTYRQRIPTGDGEVGLRTVQYVVIDGDAQYNLSCASSEELWRDAGVLCEALSRTFTLGY